jgi:hypothetical protein
VIDAADGDGIVFRRQDLVGFFPRLTIRPTISKYETEVGKIGDE